jgi:hypothetical protein
MSTTNDPEGTIPPDQAILWAKNWRDYMAASGQVFNVRAFKIPIIDIQNIMKYNPDADCVWAYIVLKTPNDPFSATMAMVPSVNGQQVMTLEDGESNVYDNMPYCPPVCYIGPMDS